MSSSEDGGFGSETVKAKSKKSTNKNNKVVPIVFPPNEEGNNLPHIKTKQSKNAIDNQAQMQMMF
jgi:hypothetical protein